MKLAKQWSLGVLAVFFAACGGGNKPVTADAQVLAPPPKALDAPKPEEKAVAPLPEPKLDLPSAAKKYVADMTAAWAAKDPKKSSAVYASDAVVAITGPKGWDETGPAGMEQGLAGYYTAFPDLKLTYTRVIGRGNVAVAEWVFTGTNTGSMRGQKPTNKKVGYRGASVLTFASDGKVKRENVYFDMATMMGQAGLGPKGPPVRAVEATPTGATTFWIAADGDPASDTLAKIWLTDAQKGAKDLAALATDDIVVSNQYMPSDTKGKKAFEKDVSEGLKAFAEPKFSGTTCVPATDLIACEYTWTATWKGPAMGMKPTGKTGTVHSLEVFEIKNGKVARTTAYANGVEFASTFGLMDAPPPAAPPPTAPPAAAAAAPPAAAASAKK